MVETFADTCSDQAPATAPHEKKLEGLTVLIIEDNKDLLTLYRQRLENNYGATIEEARSAHRAREILASKKVDLILCDLIMPEEGGFEFIQRLRRNEGSLGQHTAAIAISALDSSHYASKAKQSGFDRLLAKPISVEDLANAIAKTVNAIKRTELKLAAKAGDSVSTSEAAE